ncbi:MAG: PKD domain-containing protein, partial [Chloroflexota bacterium]|nr:PKD domain-containing protein [Chloroflexota bacterium]
TTQSVAVRVTDDAGATAGASLIVEILNATPVVVSGDTQTLDEGSQFAATGSFSDAGMLDTHSATVNYGDGSGDEPLALNDDRSFALAHTYSDNGTYVATVSVSDDDGATGTATTMIVVNNVAPSVTLGDDATLRRGETLVSSGSFTDPGADDWTATVDYGDGSATEALTLNADGTFTLAHAYTTAGSFTISVCVSDDDSGQGCDTLTLSVTPYAIFAGRDDCGSGSADAIQWIGSNGTLYSDLHSNNGLKVSGSKNTVTGSASYRCQVKVSGSQNTFTSGPDKVTDTRPWPVQMDATAFTCDVTVAGTLDLSKDGVWWVDGTMASQQLAPLTLCAAEIMLSGSNITGTVTLVAEQISLGGSNIRLAAYQHGVLLFATGSGKDAIKVSGSKNQLMGDLVARGGGIDLSGSGNQILGALIGWTVKLSGSNWTVDARVTVSP